MKVNKQTHFKRKHKITYIYKRVSVKYNMRYSNKKNSISKRIILIVIRIHQSCQHLLYRELTLPQTLKLNK